MKHGLSSSPRILVVGDVMLDIEALGVSRSNVEETEACYVGTEWVYLPGGAANVASLLHKAGADVTLCGAVGKDWGALELENLLEACDTYLSRSLPVTTIKLRAYEQGKVVAHTRLDREDPQLGNMVYPEGLRRYDAIVLSDYAKGVFSPEGPCGEWLQEAVLGVVDCPVVVDPHPRNGREPMDWTGATLATPNLSEWHALGLGGAEWTAVTLGADGCDLRNAKGELVGHYACAQAVSNPQVVGAGDSFTAACALGLAGGLEVTDVVRAAVSFAANYVRRGRA
jgi:D-beta-D-heptose 7-phosphate kinase/D-beta-D-heptose 1-phosphate adenosyltransferase